MESFFVAVNAVTPFLIYIAFGYGVRMSGLVDEKFMNTLNKLIFNAFFPILMFNNLYKVKSGFTLDVRLIVLGVTCVLLLQAILIFIVPRLVKGNPQRGVVIQAIYRSNFILFGLPLTTTLFGEDGAVVASMMIAIIIPIYNVTAVIILELFHGGRVNPKGLIKNVCTNPLILGAFTGLIFFLLKIQLPKSVDSTITQFANLTTPLALFVLGGTLHFSAIRGNLKYLVPSLVAKLVVIPMIIMMIATGLGFANLERFILFVMFATPVATASYSMAQNMGGDGELAGQFVVVSTAVSVVTIFLWVFLFTSIGFI
ncbi:MAG: AEC family transporter [Clostridium sp.]